MTKQEWKEEALKIGQHIVDVYGAQVEDVEIDHTTGNLIVLANEHGEKLSCEITPLQWAQYANELKGIE